MTNMTGAGRFLCRQQFVAFDTETTGLWAPSNRIVELAAVRFRTGEDQVSNFQSLIDPERPIPEEVIEIHGITDQMVAGAPSADVVLTQFREFCGDDSILIAHNAPFDISFVACELGRASLQFGDNLVLDTVDIFRRFYPNLESYSLLSLASRFGIAQTQLHRALEDADLVRLLFLQAAPHLGSVNSLDDLRSHLTTSTMAEWPGECRELPPEFAELQRALKEELRVEIIYRSASQPAHKRVVRPRQVYTLGSQYYITAWCERSRAERTFRLDRVESFRVLE
ncbi:MAG: exonuclease domain-containing protein [bacterium]